MKNNTEIKWKTDRNNTSMSEEFDYFMDMVFTGEEVDMDKMKLAFMAGSSVMFLKLASMMNEVHERPDEKEALSDEIDNVFDAIVEELAMLGLRTGL